MYLMPTAYRIKIGDFLCIVFTDGKITGPDDSPENAMDVNCIYIEGEGRRILVDTGCGTQFQAAAGKLVRNLETEGIKTGEITDIIITHTHIDHIGGMVNKEGGLGFPNARYTITRKEWQHLLEPPGSNEWHNTLFAPARRDLVPLKERFNLVGDGYRILPGIKLIPAGGHTPGNIIVDIQSSGERLLCVGDIIHIPLELKEPEKLAFLDIAPDAAQKARKEILSAAAREGTLVFTCHFNFPGLGYMREKKGVLSWEAV